MNIFSFEPKKELAKKLRKLGHEICQNGIDNNFILDSLNEFDFGFICIDESKRRDDKILGFVLYNINDTDKNVEVLLLCTRVDNGIGLGRTLISIPKEHAIQLHYNCQLNSVKKSVGFYLKCGFIFMGQEGDKYKMLIIYDENITITKRKSKMSEIKEKYGEECEKCALIGEIVEDFNLFIQKFDLDES